MVKMVNLLLCVPPMSAFPMANHSFLSQTLYFFQCPCPGRGPQPHQHLRFLFGSLVLRGLQPAVWAAAINSDSSLWAPIQTLGFSFKKWSESPSVMSNPLQPHGLYSPWNSPYQNSGLAFPPPGDLPNQGSNPGLLHHRRILYQLSHRAVPNYSHLRCPKVGRYSLPTSPTSPRGPRTKNRPDETTGDWTPQIVYAYLLDVWESASTCLRPNPKWLFVEWMNAPMEVSWVFLSKWVSTLSDYSLPPFPALPGTEPPQC